VDKEKMRPDRWLELVRCVPFSALTLIVGWHDGHLAHENLIPLITRGSLP